VVNCQSEKEKINQRVDYKQLCRVIVVNIQIEKGYSPAKNTWWLIASNVLKKECPAVIRSFIVSFAPNV
jgi:hypothetical protein